MNYFPIFWQKLPESPPSLKEAWKEVLKLSLVIIIPIVIMGVFGG